jgi:hypothetical protein
MNIRISAFQSLETNATDHVTENQRSVARFLKRRPGFVTRPVQIVLLLEKVIARQAFLPVDRFPFVIIIPLMLHGHISVIYHRHDLFLSFDIVFK